jgi:transcriptional regulator with XRE-family HTH domain
MGVNFNHVDPMNMPDFAAMLSELQVTPFLGEAIATLREQRGMTQAELAEASGLNLSGIKRLEGGLRKHGGWMGSVERVCRAMKVSMETLLSTARALALLALLEQVWRTAQQGG